MKHYLHALSSLALAICMAPVSASPAAPKADPVQGETAAAACIACHTADGSRGVPAHPILQGQHKEYIAKQLAEFKAGKRVNAVMQGMAALVPDEATALNIGAFYESRKTPAGAATDAALATLGQKIFRGGIADRSIPACAACHGATGAGMPAQYPRLAGQNAEYTESQLKAYRDGTRTNNAQMLGVAAKLNDKEIKALADYIAGMR